MSKSSEAVKRCRDNRKEKMIQAMGGCCQLCGFSHPDTLAMHHIVPKDKRLSFGNIRANNTNWPEIVIELRKCILLCQNCHSIIHSNGLDKYNFTSSFNEDYATIQKVDKGHLSNPEDLRYCIVCSKILKNSQLNCCSENCRLIHTKQTRQKVNWDLEILNILELRYTDKLTYKAIGIIYGVSDRTIADKIKQYEQID